jgi:hypothetical protein
MPWPLFFAGDRDLGSITVLSVRYGLLALVLIDVVLVLYSGGVILPWLWRKLAN